MNGKVKECFKCKTTKPLSGYYKHPQMADGHLNKCTECARQDARKVRKRRLVYYREYDRNRGASPHRKAANKQYMQTSDGKSSHRKAGEKWRANNPLMRKAYNKVSKALKDGRLVKEPCEVCGTKTHVQAHHDDYEKPLVVRWLCPTDHAIHHKEMRNDQREQLQA